MNQLAVQVDGCSLAGLLLVHLWSLTWQSITIGALCQNAFLNWVEISTRPSSHSSVSQPQRSDLVMCHLQEDVEETCRSRRVLFRFFYDERQIMKVRPLAGWLAGWLGAALT